MKSKNTKNTKNLEHLADEFIDALHQDLQNSTEIPHQPHSPQKPAIGQLWTAFVTTPDHKSSALIYIQKTSPTHCESLLVHDHTWMSCHDDLVLDPYASPTGDPLVVCLWNPLHVRLENLGEHIDSLSNKVSKTIVLLTDPQNSLKKTAIDHDTLDHVPTIEWEIQTPDGFNVRYLTGTRPITDADPRLRARTALQEATSPLNNTVDHTDHPLIPPIQAFFERLQKAVANHTAHIPAPPTTNQQIPALSFDFGALNHNMRDHTSTDSLPQKLHEFSLRCGPATVNICISTGPTGITLDGDALDGDALDATQNSIPDLQIRLSQLQNPQTTLIWQGTTDDFGEFNSPPLNLQFDNPQRLELKFHDHTTVLDF